MSFHRAIWSQDLNRRGFSATLQYAGAWDWLAYLLGGGRLLYYNPQRLCTHAPLCFAIIMWLAYVHTNNVLEDEMNDWDNFFFLGGKRGEWRAGMWDRGLGAMYTMCLEMRYDWRSPVLLIRWVFISSQNSWSEYDGLLHDVLGSFLVQTSFVWSFRVFSCGASILMGGDRFRLPTLKRACFQSIQWWSSLLCIGL